MEEQREKNNERGITLIALVITIIILIILATVSISTVLGDNGIIDIAKDTENKTSSMIDEENDKMNKLLSEYANIMVEDSEFPLPPTVEEILDITDNQKIYVEIPNIKDPENPIICNVLYNDETNGLQVISVGSVENVTLGNNDFEEAKGIYNDVINILNNKAMEYIDAENVNYSLIANIVEDARCVGSVPTNKNKDASGWFYIPNGGLYNGQLRDTDTNYETDFNQMGTLGIRDIDEDYWLASRNVISMGSGSISRCYLQCTRCE